MASYDAFLSHSYGPANIHHNQVAQIARELQMLQSPLTPWLDETNLPYAADLQYTFENAIDSSRCFFLFLTQEYQEKVFDQSRAFNWCRYEFRAAIHMNKQILVILLDPALRDPRTSWFRSLQILLGSRRYFDMSDPTIFGNPQFLTEKCILLGRILDEFRTNGEMASAINTVLPNNDSCPIHGEHYEYYDTVSDQVICRHCAMTTHRGHTIVTITEEAQQIRENYFLAIQQRLTNIINEYQQRATILMESRENDIRTRDNYQQQIHDVFRQMREAITETENRMIAIVLTQHNHQRNTVDQHHTQTLESQQQTQDLLHDFNHSTTNVSLVTTWIQAKNSQTENIDFLYPFRMSFLQDVLFSSLTEFNLSQNRLLDWCSIISQSTEVLPNYFELDWNFAFYSRFLRKVNLALPPSYTCLFVVKVRSNFASLHRLNNDPNIKLEIHNNTISVCHGINRISVTIAVFTNTLEENQYSHVCWTVHDGVMKLYLDGLQIGQTTGTFNWTNSCEPVGWSIGHLQVQRVLWWDRSLLSNEIEALRATPYVSIVSNRLSQMCN